MLAKKSLKKFNCDFDKFRKAIKNDNKEKNTSDDRKKAIKHEKKKKM